MTRSYRRWFIKLNRYKQVGYYKSYPDAQSALIVAKRYGYPKAKIVERF